MPAGAPRPGVCCGWFWCCAWPPLLLPLPCRFWLLPGGPPGPPCCWWPWERRRSERSPPPLPGGRARPGGGGGCMSRWYLWALWSASANRRGRGGSYTRHSATQLRAGGKAGPQGSANEYDTDAGSDETVRSALGLSRHTKTRTGPGASPALTCCVIDTLAVVTKSLQHAESRRCCWVADRRPPFRAQRPPIDSHHWQHFLRSSSGALPTSEVDNG